MTQAEIEFVAPCKVPPEGSQNYELLMVMKSGKRLTVAAAVIEHSCYALSQRCGELRRMGWPIRSRMIEIRPGTRVSEYWLEDTHGGR